MLVNSEKGTKEKRWPDGRLEVWYANGNRKEISPDQKVVKVFYYNGDMKVNVIFGSLQPLFLKHTENNEGGSSFFSLSLTHAGTILAIL